MIFRFLLYLQPTYTFTLFKSNGSSVFPIIENLPKEVLDQIDSYTGYKSTLAKKYDVSWQAIQKGYIGNIETYRSFDKVSVIDEYIFTRRYFNSFWSFYVLLIRLLTFKNPIVEITSWRNSRNTKRLLYFNTPLLYSEYINYNSPLIKNMPLVSVIIPTLNRYEYLKDVLNDLEAQTYKNIEVIIVDQSSPFREEFYENFNLGVQLINQKEKALWLARNRAIEASKGEYILLFDDDSRVEPDWIINHLKCLDFFNADISSGISISNVGASVPENYSYFKVSSQLDTGNVLIKLSVFNKIGLFDRQFEKQRMGDGEFGLRAYLKGYLNISNPFSQRLHLKVDSGGLREMGSWDGFRPKNILAPRPIPSVLYFLRKYYGNKRSVLVLMKMVPPSIIPYHYKKNKKMLVVGLLISLFLFPFVLLQVCISWRLATKKLKEGAKIKWLMVDG